MEYLIVPVPTLRGLWLLTLLLKVEVNEVPEEASLGGEDPSPHRSILFQTRIYDMRGSA